jgi:hypothetical protein
MAAFGHTAETQPTHLFTTTSASSLLLVRSLLACLGSFTVLRITIFLPVGLSLPFPLFPNTLIPFRNLLFPIIRTSTSARRELHIDTLPVQFGMMETQTGLECSRTREFDKRNTS